MKCPKSSILVTVLLLVSVTLSACGLGAGGNYPARDITLIIPFQPGGSTDPIGRQYATQLEKQLGKRKIIVENREGGSGTVGTAATVQAKPDGYTLGLSTNAVVGLTPLTNQNLPFKETGDYQPIVKLADLPQVISVRADAPWKTFEEFIAHAKANPKQVRVATPGNRTQADLTVHRLNKVAGTEFVTVPFTGGGGQALAALLGGQVEAYIEYPISHKAQADAGKVRPLVIFQKERSELLPTATPVAAAGYDVTLPAMYFILAPKGLPKDVQDRLVNASIEAVKTPEFLKFCQENGYLPDPEGPEGLVTELRQYRDIYADILKTIGGQ